jgi:hypothetical protein
MIVNLFLVGELRFAFFYPIIQIKNIEQHSFTVFDKRQLPGVPHLTNGPDGPAQVFGCFFLRIKTLFQSIYSL